MASTLPATVRTSWSLNLAARVATMSQISLEDSFNIVSAAAAVTNFHKSKIRTGTNG